MAIGPPLQQSKRHGVGDVLYCAGVGLIVSCIGVLLISRGLRKECTEWTGDMDKLVSNYTWYDYRDSYDVFDRLMRDPVRHNDTTFVAVIGMYHNSTVLLSWYNHYWMHTLAAMPDHCGGTVYSQYLPLIDEFKRDLQKAAHYIDWFKQIFIFQMARCSTDFKDLVA